MRMTMSEIIPQAIEIDRDKAAVAKRHKEEWIIYRQACLAPAADSGDPEQAHFAKTIADAIKSAQEGERKSWDMHGGETQDNQHVYRWEDGNDAA